MYRADVVKKDMDLVKRINPNVLTLEKWMRKHEYKGNLRRDLLKKQEEGSGVGANLERIEQL